MNFSVTLPADWLQKRRTQVAEASRRIRAKRKKEEDDLREENLRLREERAAFLKKITELESQISALTERDVDLEHELLRTQLEQHKSFLLGFLDTIVSMEPSERSSKGELSRQTRDFTMMHAQRIITESQRNIHSWHQIEDRIKLENKADYSLFWTRADCGVTHIRFDYVLPHLEASQVRNMTIKYWYDQEAFRLVLGPHQKMEARELEEFRVDDAANEETLRTYHVREPLENGKILETAFAAAVGKTVMSKSTLQLPPGKGPLLSQCLSVQEALSPALGSAKRTRLAKQEDPVDWGICGTTSVYYGFRTVTGHGAILDRDDDENIERMMSTSIEADFYWNEEIESSDPDVRGPCCRGIALLSLPVDLNFPAIGGIEDFITKEGRLGDKLTNALRNFVHLAYLSREL